MLNSRKAEAQPKQRADRGERWNEGLGVNYTVDNFGIIDDSDSGNDVACCILPKHAPVPERAVAQEQHQESGESNQVGCELIMLSWHWLEQVENREL